MWQHACDEVMNIKEPSLQQSTAQAVLSRRSKCVSLYDETPWKGIVFNFISFHFITDRIFIFRIKDSKGRYTKYELLHEVIHRI